MTGIKLIGMQLALDNRDNKNYVVRRVKQQVNNTREVQLIVLSELCFFGPGSDKKHFYLEHYIDELCDLAKYTKSWLIPGTFYQNVNGKIFNIAPVFNPEGELAAKCLKNFPWLPYEKNVDSTDQSTLFTIPNVGTVGLHICYDLWFPETSRILALKGAEMIVNPTLTPTKDREIETIMARATAAQQQLYYVDINGGSNQAIGKSIVCDPNGSVIHQSGKHEDIFTLTLDFDLVRKTRQLGTFGLGQPLKSFRDHSNYLELYANRYDEDFLSKLGPLVE